LNPTDLKLLPSAHVPTTDDHKTSAYSQ